MKTWRLITIFGIALLDLLPNALAQSSDLTSPPTTDSPAPPAAAAADSPNAASETGPPRPAARQAAADELRLNFRNAPLETVLNYLSEAAGFIIELRTEVKGKVTVWSNQPVTREEALDLLNSALDSNGYTAVRKGRTLTILSKDAAKKHDLPVKSGNRPEDIPRNDTMVTQILPVRFINAVQVSRDLQPLLPDNATMTANEGGNALIITDTQINIRRLAEIVRALDTAISSVSSVKVFPLHYADAKAVATVIKDLFAPQETARTTGNAAAAAGRFFNQFRGAGGRGGGGDTGAGAATSAAGGGRAPTPRVVAVAEERSNSVVVSAPDEQMPIIEDLIAQVDTNVEDITELRVFRLRFADAQETADLLTNLFADTSRSGQNSPRQFQFGGRFGGNRGAGAGTTTAQSSRILKQSTVVAVPDLRTGSVVVSAARDLMDQIARVVEDLDSDPAKKQQVFVFSLENTDPQAAQDILQSLFPAPLNGNLSNTRLNNRGQNSPGSQLNNRATQNQNQGFGRTGNTGFGGVGGGGGGVGSAFGR